jgi:hypothetical protein
MRTTLTLEDDVAIGLERVRKERDASLKDVVNEALRLGLHDMRAKSKARKPIELKVFDVGEPLFPIDNIAEAIAFGEGEDYK